ncbi:nitrogen fixation S (NIFS)-like 1 [Artemisia annua]|uniref:cysteine desulfurase n=1 Tax=Artemisia annua TaxID=35608 RepID=A0A2U1PRT8_ARTAN|nr:nitrogen fixation S (NIFS)-like 1 [Artemisia annua]
MKVSLFPIEETALNTPRATSGGGDSHHPHSLYHNRTKPTTRQQTKMSSKILSAAIRRHSLLSHTRRLSTAAAAAISPTEHPYDETTPISMKGVKISGRPLYLDMQATSPVDPRVLDAMLPYFTSQYGNPHSRTHLYGWESDHAVEHARAQVASLIHASPKEVVFTSGATECNNISVKGVMHFYKEKKKHVVTTQTEHKCVLDSCRYLQQHGFDVTYLRVKPDGLVDLDELRNAIRTDTGLVSVMAVNNEIGVIQPMEEIGEICREFNVPFHTDAAQALGKIPIDVNKWNVSLMSLSGHKVYGPKGVGALYMRRRPRIRVEPQMNGGGQERGIRSGTVPTPLVVGMGAACEIAMKEMVYDENRIMGLKDRLLNGIRERLDGVVVNGSVERRYAGNLNLSFAYVEGESLLMGLKEVAVSSGSACTSASLEPSYVLRALGVDEDMAHTSIRFGIGRFTTEEEIDKARLS